MSALANQKSQLAKLMATENISVQHSKIRTAMFDTKNRVLYLPIWKNMDGYLYDLLGGHEVGHALYTPTEGWHNAAADKSKGKNYKSFLNVIEDARIEKKVKRKYPGLRSSFVKAYEILFNQDFFGIKNRDINSMPFIDRLNIYSKSQYTASFIKFNYQEEVYVNKIQNLETWDDVVSLTDEIYEYSKGEQQIKQQFDDFTDEFDDSNDDYGLGDPDEYDFDEDDSYEDEEGNSQSTKSKKSDDESDDESNSNSEDDESADKSNESEEIKSENNSYNRQKESNPSESDQYSPECETDSIYRNKEMLLVDDSCKEYNYLELPTPIISNIVTPFKRVHEQLKAFYKHDSVETKTLVRDFKMKNERYVSLLAKEFEMRKAAKSFSKSKVSETGDIDIGKLSNYKFDDNIFRRITTVAKGKKHGLILLLDRSGSMSNNMSGSIEQILVLSMFCRKVNIPFVVYGFGDSVFGRQCDFPKEKENITKECLDCFSKDSNQIDCGIVYLREYLNSKLTNSEFNRAITNLILLKQSYESRRSARPRAEDLSNTPLTQALVALAPIMNEFRKVNNLDINNLVIVHDGDSDGLNAFYKRNDSDDMTRKYFDNYNYVNILRDNKIKFQMQIARREGRSDPIYDVVFQWFKAVTGSKVFGFYIAPGTYGAKNALSNHYELEDKKILWQLRAKHFNTYNEKLKQLLKVFKDQKFIANKTGYFDEFYFVQGGEDFLTEIEEIEIEGKITSSKLKNAFLKMNKKRAVNRILVTKFIQGIAV